MEKLKFISILGVVLGALAFQGSVTAADKEAEQEEKTVRAEVGEPLQEARDLLHSGQHAQALAKIDAAETAVEKLDPYEVYLINRMRGSVAAAGGDYGLALEAYQRVLGSGQLPPAERVPIVNAMARMAYTASMYPRAIELIKQYRDEGGTDSETLMLLPQAYYQIQRYDAAARELIRQINVIEESGRQPSEQKLQILASAQLKQDNADGYLAALRKTVAYYPEKNYWSDLIIRTARHADLPPRLGLDLYRLRKYTDTMGTTGDYMAATQLALQAGFPKEAETFLNEGFENGLLGDGSGGDVNRHLRLKKLVEQKIASDKQTSAEGEEQAAQQAGGNALINTGLNYIAYGQYEKGVALMKQGLARDDLENSQQAKLHLGYAQLLAGQKQDAVQTFGSVGGDRGERELARLWILAARSF